MDLSVSASEESTAVTVKWSLPRNKDEVIEYHVFFNHPNKNITTTLKRSADATSAIFTEDNALQRVYSVSIQALSQHLPSVVVGPVTVRGLLLFVQIILIFIKLPCSS